LSVSVAELPFSQTKCPHCGSANDPIQCGGCQRLVCSGQIEATSRGRYFTCRRSCGTSGYIEPWLQTVTGHEGGEEFRNLLDGPNGPCELAKSGAPHPLAKPNSAPVAIPWRKGITLR
jgi:hypothetical protein